MRDQAIIKFNKKYTQKIKIFTKNRLIFEFPFKQINTIDLYESHNMSLVLNGVTIESRASDNFVNATQLCQAGGKEFSSWYRLESTKELIQELEKNLNMQIHMFKNLVDVKKGRYDSGSWIHPDLAVPLAQWISPAFAIQVSRWIRELFITGHVSIDSEKSNEELIALQNQVLKLELENKEKEISLELKEQQIIEIEDELKQKDEQIDFLKENTIKIELDMKDMHHMKPDGFIYLITTSIYSKQNAFRLGKTEFLNRRQRQHCSARAKNDQYFYVYYRKVENMDLCELLLRKFLSKYREEAYKDMYIMPFSILRQLVDNIIDIYSTQLVTLSNQAVDDVLDYKISDTTRKEEQALIEKCMEPDEQPIKIMAQSIVQETAPRYFEQIMELYKDYEGFDILTPKEDLRTMHDKVQIKCPHMTRAILVRTILNQIGCAECEKALKIRKLELQKVDIEHKGIELISETDEAFNKLNSRDKARIVTQNQIVTKFATENIKLLTAYKNFDTRFSYACSFGHAYSTTWNCLKKLTVNYCRPCREVSSEKIKVTISKHSSEDELKEIAASHGFEYVSKSAMSGIYVIKCTQGHNIERYKRDFGKKCKKCMKSNKLAKN